MSVVCLCDGVCLSAASLGEHPLPFGPHRFVSWAAEEHPEPRERKQAAELVRQLTGGFTRLYLFTWLDASLDNEHDAEDVPDVRVADLWIE